MRTQITFDSIPEHAPLWAEAATTDALRRLEELPYRGLSIVGTRRPAPRAAAQVQEVLRELRGLRVIILSGFASGIDAEAHEGALRNDLPTVAILGHGLDHTYPPQHRDLRRRILESGGALLSPFRCEELPRPRHFAYRNRWIAELARATWLVQASHDSGANITAQMALRSGKDLYVTPAFPWEEAFRGNCERLESPLVRPLVRARQFAQTWEDWSEAFRRRRLGRDAAPGDDAGALREHLSAWMAQFGAATFSDLLEWSRAVGWLPSRLREALQKGLSEGWLRDERGFFTVA